MGITRVTRGEQNTPVALETISAAALLQIAGAVGALPTVGFEVLTVGVAAVGLASVPGTATRAVIQVMGAPVRARSDGVSPTGVVGQQFYADDLPSPPITSFLEVGTAADLGAIEFIRDALATKDATLQITYFGV